MGFCPVSLVAQAQDFAVDEKGRGLEGGGISAPARAKSGALPSTPSSFRSPQYGHCPAVNNVATLAMWAASRASTMNQISFFSVKEV